MALQLLCRAQTTCRSETEDLPRLTRTHRVLLSSDFTFLVRSTVNAIRHLRHVRRIAHRMIMRHLYVAMFASFLTIYS